MRIDNFIRKVNNDNKPAWYKRIILISFRSSLIIWPLLFFMSIFLFDNPRNWILTLIIFGFINIIPLIFISLINFGHSIFDKYRHISIIISFIPLSVFLLFLFLVLFT